MATLTVPPKTIKSRMHRLVDAIEDAELVGHPNGALEFHYSASGQVKVVLRAPLAHLKVSDDGPIAVRR